MHACKNRYDALLLCFVQKCLTQHWSTFSPLESKSSPGLLNASGACGTVGCPREDNAYAQLQTYLQSRKMIHPNPSDQGALLLADEATEKPDIKRFQYNVTTTQNDTKALVLSIKVLDDVPCLFWGMQRYPSTVCVSFHRKRVTESISLTKKNMDVCWVVAHSILDGRCSNPNPWVRC